MALNVITCDLNRPGQSYPHLWDALEKAGAKRILESTWAFKAESSTDALRSMRDNLMNLIDKNDRLYIAEVNTWSGVNLMMDLNKL